MTTLITEKHYRVRDLVEAWSLSRFVIDSLFRNEPGVLRVGGPDRITMSIPASVAARVHERLSNNRFKAATARGNPSGVIRLRDLYTRMPKKPGDIIKINPPKQTPNRKGVAQPMGAAV